MYFTYRGIPSYQMGITVTKRPTFTVAAQQLSTYDTPGIDGILVENEGKHSIVIQMDIVIDNMDMFDDINEWLTGKGRFTRSDYPDRYMDVEVQSGLFNQFVGSTYYQTPISFYAYDPYWYPTENVDRAFRNLIKDDFSDFNAYQGATVTKNKTFPIDVFKGGRNLLYGFEKNQLSTQGVITGSEVGWLSGAFTWDIESNYIFSILDKLTTENSFFIFLFDENNLPIARTNGSVWENNSLINERSFRAFVGGNDISDLVRAKHGRLYLYSIVGQERVYDLYPSTNDIKFKLEKGSTPTDYSPSPIDGYGYTGEDGAYHVQTGGGDTVIKYLASGGRSVDGLEYKKSIKVKNFNEKTLQLGFNGIGTNKLVYHNEFMEYNTTGLGNGVSSNQIQFRAVNMSDSLDFIASDPHITDLVLEEWLPVTNEIVNNGTTASKPILRITRGNIGTADLTVNGTRFLYFFQGTSVGTQVEIDFNLRTAKEGDTLTTPNLMIGYAYPIMDVGSNKVINKGNHKLEIRRESRYL